MYDLVLGNEVKTSLAFNYSSSESKLQQLNRNELETIFADANNISIFDVANETEFSNTLRKQYKGTPYWKYALILGLFFLLLEVAFVRLL